MRQADDAIGHIADILALLLASFIDGRITAILNVGLVIE
jgi:hypothetical protein